MRLTLQVLQNYLLQEIPSVIISSGTTKYIFNVPSTFQRFVRDHKIKFPKGANYFFTKSSAATTAGLNGFLLTIFQSGAMDSKLFLSKEMYDYMEDTRYKMGFKMLPFSYCQWSGERSRAGIKSAQLIKELVEREDFSEIFDELESFIKKEMKPEDVNLAIGCFDQQDRCFKDEDLRILPIFIEAAGEKVIQYIVVSKPLPGKVLNDKIKELGIPPKFISRILEVQSFQLPSMVKGEPARLVKRQEIQEKDQPGPAVAILHIDSLQVIEKLMQNETFQSYISKNSENPLICAVFLVQSHSLIESSQFRQLLKSFPADCERIISCESLVSEDPKKFRLDSFVKPHMQVVSGLNKIFPLCMPDLVTIHREFIDRLAKGGQGKDLEKGFAVNLEKALSGLELQKVHIGQRGDQMVLAPIKNRGFKKNLDPLDVVKVGQGLKEMSQLQKIEIQKFLQAGIQDKLPFNPQVLDPKVIFLGTGSMKPGTYRNVSSIMLELNSENSFLLDCGESSLYQLMNHYPLEESDRRLLNIRVVFITHIHCDHNLGILDLISRRNALMKKYNEKRKLYLIIPCNVYPWFRSFNEHIEDLREGCELLFIQTLRNEEYTLGEATMSKDQRKCPKSSGMEVELSEEMIAKKQISQKNAELKMGQGNVGSVEEKPSQVKSKIYHFKTEENMVYFKKEAESQPKIHEEFLKYLKTDIGISSFYPMPVIHCPQSFGIVIQHPESKVKISYTGDTRPCQEFAKAAFDSTLMIHEATFGDQLVQNAIDNFHSTVGQALEMQKLRYLSGKEAKCWKTALTHFSQRYVSAKTITDRKNYQNSEMKQYLERHGIVCFDHLEVKLSQAWKLPVLTQGIASCIDSDE